MIGSILKKIVGSKNDRELKRLQQAVENINALEPEIQALSDSDLVAKTVEFRARLRIIEESFALPGVAVGFDSQGFGYYDETTERYQVKSKGFYAVASKHYAFLGMMAFHGGVNYSLEDGDGEDAINLFFGDKIAITDG